MVATGAPLAASTVTCDSNLLREVVEANARWIAVRRSAVTGRVSGPTICGPKGMRQLGATHEGKLDTRGRWLSTMLRML